MRLSVSPAEVRDLGWALLFSSSLVLAACEGDTSGLGDGTVQADGTADAGPRDLSNNQDAEPGPELGPEDAGVLPEEWTVVPCPASAMPLPSPLIAGGGALEGVLTVFVSRYPRDAALGGSRVVLRKRERMLEGTTDDRGCVRFIGRDLTGPVEILASATDYSMSVVRGLGSAQLGTGVQSRASLSQPITLPPPPVGVVAGSVTGLERFPSVTSTGAESRHVRASVVAVYRRTAIPFGRPEAGRRPAPHDELWANIAYVGKLDRGVSPAVDLRDFELPVWTDDVVGLEVDGEHEIDWGGGTYTRVRPYVGVTLGLTLSPDERLEGQTVDLAIPRTRSFAVTLPEPPDWAAVTGAVSELYLPEADALAFSHVVGQNSEPILRPEFAGALSTAEELVSFSAVAEASDPNQTRPTMLVYARSRAEVVQAPAFPARPELSITDRRLSVSFPGPRDGALLNLSLSSPTGVLSIIDLGGDPSFEFDIPAAEETLAIPDLYANLFVAASWPRDRSGHEVRIANDGIELRARFYESYEADLRPD